MNEASLTAEEQTKTEAVETKSKEEGQATLPHCFRVCDMQKRLPLKDWSHQPHQELQIIKINLSCFLDGQMPYICL